MGKLGAYGGVAAPDVDVGVWYNLAGLVINNLDRQRELDALLAIGNVLPDFLALHVYPTVSGDIHTLRTLGLT
jgi:hypothetical protein